MINTEDVSSCCGCSACAYACPKRAIHLVQDIKGFFHPQLDETKCINCGLCDQVCDFRQFMPSGLVPNAVVCRNKNDQEVETSRSGAFFPELCHYVIAKGGVVFGCELVEGKRVVHRYETTEEGVQRFKGSKYVQSELNNTFSECVNFLSNGRHVLFSGTACQIGGLLSLLKYKNISTHNLITCDLVCHGTPSPKIWELYAESIEKKYKKVLQSVDFRDKKAFGWRAHIETYHFTDRSFFSSKKWTNLFYENIMFRESCYHCKYTTPERRSDFTLADCWGIENVAPELNDDKGASLILLHSAKAREIFSILCSDFEWRSVDLGCVMQKQLQEPAAKPMFYNDFWQCFIKHKKRFLRKYFYADFWQKQLNRIERKIKKLIMKNRV